ncbi:MAG: T9SS type A sorting domain-containing protein [Bacteroidales bacterium]|nr:T9SS type A sorting domain-containing protein [Bacteroidales bacterium]
MRSPPPIFFLPVTNYFWQHYLKNISIFSVSGQLIYETPTTGDTFEYDFGKHGAGVYLVKIETAKGIVTRKVTVK